MYVGAGMEELAVREMKKPSENCSELVGVYKSRYHKVRTFNIPAKMLRQAHLDKTARLHYEATPGRLVLTAE